MRVAGIYFPQLSLSGHSTVVHYADRLLSESPTSIHDERARALCSGPCSH
jgi:hypothetical protein